MRIEIRRSADLDRAKELHKLSFPSDEWPGDDHEYWFAFDGASVVGWASASFFDQPKSAFLSRAAVAQKAHGHGLHRRLITVRARWAVSAGARFVATYVHPYNYQSFVNLLRCGFRFSPATFRTGKLRWHVMYTGKPTEIELRQWWSQAIE